MLSDEGRQLLAVYRRAEAGRSVAGASSFQEIRCKVARVDRARRLVVLRSVHGDGDVVVTVKGGDLSRSLSPDDEITLTLG